MVSLLYHLRSPFSLCEKNIRYFRSKSFLHKVQWSLRVPQEFHIIKPLKTPEHLNCLLNRTKELNSLVPCALVNGQAFIKGGVGNLKGNNSE